MTNLLAALLDLAGQATDIDLVDRISQLSGPALMVLFIWLLAAGKIRWERELVRERAETEAWREAAIGRTADRERGATIAEAALDASRRARRR